MNHLSDDDLQRRVLELLDESDILEQDLHLDECTLCSNRLIEIRNETEHLGSLAPGISIPEIPLPRSRKVPLVRILKIAALLLVGFMAGYRVSRSPRTQLVTVVPYHLSHSSVEQPMSGFTVCD